MEQHWVTEMELLGEKGDVNAMATLIHMYTVGWGGMQPDLVKAEAWRKVRRTTPAREAEPRVVGRPSSSFESAPKGIVMIRPHNQI